MNPILVVGMNRGGTTMLGNVLCRHPEIVAPQHELHWGCKESQVLMHKQYWSDFDTPEGYEAFLNAYSADDYFVLARGDYDHFLHERPASFYEFFLDLMDRFCAAEGATYWVMKIEEAFYHYPGELQVFLNMVLDRYTNPHFIGIIRDFEGVLKSHLRRRVAGNDVQASRLSLAQQKFALSQTVRYASQRPKIRRIIRDHNGLMLDFKQVTTEPERINRTICDFLGLDYSADMLERQFEANTSFKSNRERREIIAPWQFSLLNNIALPICETLHPVGSAWRRFRDGSEPRVAPTSYRLRDAGLLPEDVGRVPLRLVTDTASVG